MHTCADAFRGQKIAMESMQLELQVFVSHLLWVL